MRRTAPPLQQLLLQVDTIEAKIADGNRGLAATITRRSADLAHWTIDRPDRSLSAPIQEEEL
jgi:hypothetical protein